MRNTLVLFWVIPPVKSIQYSDGNRPNGIKGKKMKLDNICGFRNINAYIRWKLEQYTKEESKDFATLFRFMFSEKENIMAENSDGFRIKKVTYGECEKKILDLAPRLSDALKDVPHGSLVGLYMANSLQWLQVFWGILACGYKPLLMNTRIADETLNELLTEHNVGAVISDGKTFVSPTFMADELFIREIPEAPFTPSWENEIVFMSSGTTAKSKLCVYNGENFYYQVCDSYYIVEHSTIAKHYNGQLKLLTLLPFYHVFGFIAVYLWFGFFSRTFVFLKDLHPQTLLNTIKKHKVTHIFAVPLVWDTVYKEALKKIHARGEKTEKKFFKALKLANATGGAGTKFAKKAFKEVRDNLFGDSIQFMISGGSIIRPEVLAFFNGVGYHLANGYGMTEIGITSVELSNKKKMLNSATIGKPFLHTQYKISEKGELLIKSPTRAAKIIRGGEVEISNYDEWFNSHDLIEEKGKRYFISGRKDDLIVCRNGENLNPVLVESRLKTVGVAEICLFADTEKSPVLLVGLAGICGAEKLQTIATGIRAALQREHLQDEIQTIAFTSDPLMDANDFKISRKKIAKKYASGEFKLLKPETAQQDVENFQTELEKEICCCFAEALGKSVEEIPTTADFFSDLSGSSLDYFTLTDLLKNRYGVDVAKGEGESLFSVKEVCEFISKQEN